MTNIILWANYAIAEDPSWGFESPRSAVYTELTRISQATAEQFIEGEWSAQELTGEVERRIDVFPLVYDHIRSLAGEANILFLDADTVITRPVEIFDRFQEFRLFNLTDPPWHQRFPEYYNCGVRYFPRDLSEDVWRVGDLWRRNWDSTQWDYEQQMYNAMWHHQNVGYLRRLPGLNYMMPGAERVNQIADFLRLNRCHETEIAIIHYHATRGQDSALKFARAMAEHLGVEYDI